MLLENNPYPQDSRVCNEATELASAGYRVRVIAPRLNGQPAQEVVHGVTVERYRVPLIHSGSAPRMAVEYVVAHAQLYGRGLRALLKGTDVVHAHNPPDTMFPLGLLGRAIGCKFVFDQHDVFPELVSEKYRRRRLTTIARRARRMSLGTADLVITTNDTQRSAAVREKRCSDDEVIIVRNGLSRAWLDRPIEYRRGPLRDPHLLYLGVLESQDGVDLLPAILSLLVEDYGLQGAHLTVVGSGSRLKPLKAHVAERGLDNRVEFTGLVSHDRALNAIASADICLDVAPCTEFNHVTTMVKIMEYLVLRKPVVAFPLRETMNLAGDAIAYARCDDLTSFAERVASLAQSERLRMEFVTRAGRIGQQMVWERSADALLEGYRRLECSCL